MDVSLMTKQFSQQRQHSHSIKWFVPQCNSAASIQDWGWNCLFVKRFLSFFLSFSFSLPTSASCKGVFLFGYSCVTVSFQMCGSTFVCHSVQNKWHLKTIDFDSYISHIAHICTRPMSNMHCKGQTLSVCSHFFNTPTLFPISPMWANDFISIHMCL